MSLAEPSLSEPSIEQFAGNPLAKYVAATRPPFLLVALVGALLGLASAYYVGATIVIWTAVLTVLGALIVHAGINVLNDYYDDLNGTDRANTERLFPFTGGSRFIQNGVLSAREMGRFGFGLMALTIVIGLILLFEAGIGLTVVGLLGLLIGWAYSAPPLALNSRGMGELCVAMGFGWLIPLGASYVQSGFYPLITLLVATPFALLSAVLLYINQFPDYKADEQVGKDHWVVRLGPHKARWGYLLIILMAYGLLALMLASGLLPGWCGLGFLPLPLSLFAAVGVIRFAEQPAQLLPAIKCTIAAALSHGLLMCLGLLLA